MLCSSELNLSEESERVIELRNKEKRLEKAILKVARKKLLIFQ